MKLRGWLLCQVCFAALAVEAAQLQSNPVSRWLFGSALCSPSCSPQGHCVNGRCQCREGFAGESCETPRAAMAPMAQAVPQRPALSALEKARGKTEALASALNPLSPLDLAAQRAQRIAEAADLRQEPEIVPQIGRKFVLKEAMKASHAALSKVAVLSESKASASVISPSSPGLMDSIKEYLSPSTTLFRLSTTTTGPSSNVTHKNAGCINDCSGHGMCSMGQCRCEKGYTGESCDVVQCKDDCNGRGTCREGHCACDDAFYGQACEFHRCKDDCSDHGYCDSGKCVCSSGYRGDSCADPVPAKEEPVDSVRMIAPPSCPEDCNHRGRCELDGTCTCATNYTGLACENHCPSSCSGKGACTGGQCICFFGWGGADCSAAMCCNGRGDCPIPGTCKCHEGFMGTQCEIEKKCPDPDCSGHGTCFLGTCRCENSWAGVACQQYVPPPGALGAIPPALIPAAPGMQGDPMPAALLGVSSKFGKAAQAASPAAPSCNAPHGRWSDDVGVCICQAPFHGESCEEKHCPDWDGSEGGKECSGNGVCQQGKCFCLPGFGLANQSAENICADVVCPADCGSHGSCEDGQCRCEPGWQGSTCREPQCEDECNGHGLCIFPQPGLPGACRCEEDYLPPTCAERRQEVKPALLRKRHVEMSTIRLS